MGEGSLMAARRFFLGLVAILLVAVPLFASTFPQATGLVVTLSGTTGNPETDSMLLSAVEKGVGKSLESRVSFSESATDPIEVTLGDLSLDYIVFEPQIRFTAWLRLSYAGQSFTTGVAVHGKDLKVIAKELAASVEAQLRYDTLDVLPIETDGLTLDYVWRNSLSSWLDIDNDHVDGEPQGTVPVKKGERLLVQGASGKPEAFVVVKDIIPYEDRLVASYSPLYVRSPQPGLPLVSGPNWTGTISFPIAIDLSGFGVEFSAMRSMSWYPWAPVIKGGVWCELSRSPITVQGLEVYALGGMQVEVPLGGLFDTSFTLVEDASLGAACYVGLGAQIPFDNTASSFIFGSEWDVWYRHTPSVHWGWGIQVGSQYWANVVQGKVGFCRATNLAIAPSVIFSW